MSGRFWVGFAAGVVATITIAAALTGSGPAAAQSPPVVDCAVIVGMGGLDGKWQLKMTEWLAQGRTKFVSNPSGVCAY